MRGAFFWIAPIQQYRAVICVAAMGKFTPKKQQQS